MDPLDLAYIAGFFDGEGCFRANGAKRASGALSIHPRVSIGQHQREVLDQVQSTFGFGLVVECSTPKGKPHYRYQVNHAQDIQVLCKALLPYLRVKKLQAELTLELATLVDTQGRSVVSEDNKTRRLQIFTQLKELKQ